MSGSDYDGDEILVIIDDDLTKFVDRTQPLVDNLDRKELQADVDKEVATRVTPFFSETVRGRIAQPNYCCT